MQCIPIALLIAVAQGPISPTVRFQQADRLGRVRVINEVVQGRVPATDLEIREVLEAAMLDPDASVRRTAVATVAGILQLAAMPNVPAAQSWGPRVRPVAETLVGRLEEAATDPDVRVRLEAWRGLVGPALIAARQDPLPLPIAERLAGLYENDDHPSLRAFAIGSLRTSQQSPDPAVRRIALRLLLSALRETDPYVVQAAGWNAIEAKAPEALPLLIAQLKNPSHIARMGAAVGLQGYAGLARDYLSHMEQALLNEPPGPTRSTLESAIKLVKEGRWP